MSITFSPASAGDRRSFLRIASDDLRQNPLDVVLAGTGLSTLSVSLPGNGSGQVTSDPEGIDCGSDCQETYRVATEVVLSASPGTGSDFSGWSGCDIVSQGLCTVTTDVGKSVTALFSLKRFDLTVTKSGGGQGEVTVSEGTLVWAGSTGKASYDYGTRIVLGAVPAPDTLFAGWSGGACTGTGPCEVTLDRAKEVTAAFVRFLGWFPPKGPSARSSFCGGRRSGQPGER